MLIRNAEALESFEKLDTLVVDKTGTLTEGKPTVTAILPAPGFDESMVVSLAASLEQSSEHPLAAAILAPAKERRLALQATTHYASVTGQGVTDTLGSRPVAVGNATLLEHLKVDIIALQAAAETLRTDDATAMFVAIDG